MNTQPARQTETFKPRARRARSNTVAAWRSLTGLALVVCVAALVLSSPARASVGPSAQSRFSSRQTPQQPPSGS
ncbi:MAG TPA: hypothetical protein VGV38_04105, partial [Pyrinomonadaceae bacterium]|nr:hypothetical protein [Pyrinomonadaceae bacterium]